MKFISTMLIVACCAVPGIAAARGGGGGAGTHSALHSSVEGMHRNNHHVIVRLSNHRLFAVARTRGRPTVFPFGGFPFGVPDSGTGYSNNPVVMLAPRDYQQTHTIAAAMPPCRETVAGVEIVRGKYCRS